MVKSLCALQSGPGGIIMGGTLPPGRYWGLTWCDHYQTALYQCLPGAAPGWPMAGHLSCVVALSS
jgi:hypothetical protein